MPQSTLPTRLLDRDRAILAFNQRVLDQACRPEVPLLERLRYLCIVSSNLDEFFEIRFAEAVQAVMAMRGSAADSAMLRTFRSTSEAAHALVAQQYALFNDALSPQLVAAGIAVVPHAKRTREQRAWVARYFQREVRPLLLPVSLDPTHPFPLVANKSLNFIVRLAGDDAFGRSNDIAIVKVPRVLPRVIRLPKEVSQGRQAFVLLSSVIRAHLVELFPGRQVLGFSQFRVTRDSDLAVDEQEVPNLRQALRLGLTQRHFGHAVRLEVSTACPPELTDFLMRQFGLPAQALYAVPGPVNLVRLAQVIDLVDAPQLLFPGFPPGWPASLRAGHGLFALMREQDHVMHHPFESFEPVVRLLHEAVQDPDVLAIKQTIYRTGSDSALMELLLEAARRGKEVTVVVELKARFDEEANINWAERLEAQGAQVLYGVVGLKTHAKMLLITRREGQRLRRYGHLSTGNYNPRTARLYTDVGMLTARADLTADMEAVFQHLASQTKVQGLRAMVVAPFSLHRQMMERVHETEAAARAGRDARIVLKMNALTDETLAHALAAAATAGARVDLIVRGACVLPPSEYANGGWLRVRSVVGRFLEHSRLFYFRAGERERLYLSSADWMGRNMFRRIELAWPVDDPAQRQRLVDECLTAYLHDGLDAWRMKPDGQYEPAHIGAPAGEPGRSCQQALMARYCAGPRAADTPGAP